MSPETKAPSMRGLVDLTSLPVPKSTGIGGPLSALVSAVSGYHPHLSFWILCPLWGMLALVLVLFCPVLLPLYLLAMLQRHYQKAAAKGTLSLGDAAEESHASAAGSAESGNAEPSEAEEHLVAPEVLYDAAGELKSERSAWARMVEALGQLKLWESIKQHFGFLLALLLGYYFVLVALYFGVSNASYRAMQIYMEAARKHKVLQIATPEQMTYANQMSTIFTIAGIVLIVALVVCFALTFIRLLPFKNVAASCGSLVLKNLPGLAMLTALFYAIILIMERYYAHFRIIAVEAMIRGVEYFDPALPFMVLRLYVGAVLLMSLALSLCMGLHLLPNTFSSQKDQDGGRYTPPPKSPLI